MKHVSARLAFILASLAPFQAVANVTINGANGNQVVFTAVFDATPSGLIALLKPDDSAITVPWNKIDLEHLKKHQPSIFRAYEKALATEIPQPLGLGLASEMLSLPQLPEALKQAIKDPYYWPYYSYSLETVVTNPDGTTTTHKRTTRTTPVYHSSYVVGNKPFIILKRLRDAEDDKSKKLHFLNFKDGAYYSYGVNTMVERIDYTLSRLPPAKMFPRDPQTIRLVQESIKFRKTIEELQTAETFTADHQNTIKSYFTLLGIE
jgi:hypothetical protein